MTARISVLMPCYNAAAFLRESVSSILNQTYPHFELLIADDGSTDDTRAIVGSFRDARIKRLDRPAHLGYLKIVNFLFTQVSGAFFAFQDADDRSEPTRFERQMDLFDRHPEIHLCTTDYHRTNSDGRIRTTRRWPTDYDLVRRDPTQKLKICKASILARREVLDAVPGYREFFDNMGGEDIDWAYRIVERFPARHLPEVLYRYRMHYSSAKAAHSHARYYVMQIVEKFRRQRLSTGADWLETGNHEALRAMIAELESPFADDPSYICRLQANEMLRCRKLFAAGRKASLAIVRRPLKLENYKSFAQNLSGIVHATVKGDQ
jgi:glycosyltransferase involved in cell wall biosynthesis